jgi:osmotically-inducible protein OsmY
MSRQKPFYALSCILALTGALLGCATQTVTGDAKITANVQTRFNQHPDLEGVNSINVQTLNHVVYLSGEVSEGNMSESARVIALEVPGVTRVVNNIAVSH